MKSDEIHQIGFGTYKATGEVGQRAVEAALKIGYRHIDTAEMYENQETVGAGIEESAVDRDDIFIATKLNSPNLSYADALAHAEQCRDRLGVDVIDLLYIHWPIRAYDPQETLPAMDELYDQGMIRHVGLSNFTPSLLEEAIDALDAPVFAHQIECHPFLQQRELRQLAQEYEHHIVAYCPIARGNVFDDPTLTNIAEEFNITPAQVSLAWLMSKDRVVPIPKSTTTSHINENFAATSVTLDTAAIERIDQLDRNERVIDFPEAPWNRE